MPAVFTIMPGRCCPWQDKHCLTGHTFPMIHAAPCTRSKKSLTQSQLRCAAQDVHLDDVLLAHHLEPAEGPGTTGLIELCLSLPRLTASALLAIDFQKAFLTVFDHPPDAHRGFDIPAAVLTFLDDSHEQQVWNPNPVCCVTGVALMCIATLLVTNHLRGMLCCLLIKFASTKHLS